LSKQKKKRVWKRKYGHAKKTGEFASKLESTMWKQVKKMLPKGHKLSYETKKLPYVLEKNYVPDFVISRPDGSLVFLEVKGYFRPSDRTKLLAVKRVNSDLDIRLVFDKDNKIHAKSNTTYSQWCERNGFKYCFREIPKSWFVQGDAKRSRQRKPTVPTGAPGALLFGSVGRDGEVI
jgi:hypothetical protein